MDVATVEVCMEIVEKMQVLESHSKVLQLNIKNSSVSSRDFAVSNFIYVKQLVTKRKAFSDQVKMSELLVSFYVLLLGNLS